MKWNRLATATALLFFLSSNAAAADVQIAGLTEENVNATLVNDSAIKFETSYLNKILTPRQVFVPNATEHAVVDWSYTRESWGESSGVSTLNYQYGLAYNYEYPSPEASALLGQNSSTGTGLPANYFQYSDSFYSNESTARGTVFNWSFSDDKARWNITVNAHYEHLIINYDLIYNGAIQDSYQDVYSGPDPELIPVSGQINKYDGLNTPSGDYIDRFLMRYDRKYEENPHKVTVVIAHSEDEELLSVDLGKNTEKLNDNHYSEVVDTGWEVNKTSSLLNDTSNYRIKAYNTTIEANSTTTLQYKIDSLENESNDLRMWLLGSFAGGSGTSSDPYEIDTCQQLQDMQDDLDASYELISDVDCSGTTTWNSGKGFNPIGGTFSGTLDGQGYLVDGMYIDRGFGEVGLISFLGSSGVVKDIGNRDVNISSDDYTHVGGLIAKNKGGDVSNTFTTGVVSGAPNADRIGGLIGTDAGSVSKSYSTATVDGGSIVGGLIGLKDGGGVSNSYSVGSVSGDNDVGGFIGYLLSGSTTDGYWDTENSGQSSGFGTGSGDVTGLTTSEMTGSDAETNMDFSFGGIWKLGASGNYPFLCWEVNDCNSPPVVDALDNPADGGKVYSQSPSLSLNVSDPNGDTIDVEYFLNGSSQGSDTGVSSGTSSSFEVLGLDWGTDYTWYAELSDGNGGTTTSSTYSFTTQYRPSITDSRVVVNETRYRRLVFGLDPIGVKDISGFHGLSSAFEFTNSTLKSEVSFPFTGTVNVSDSKGAYSGNKDVDLSESDTGHRQDTDQSSSLSTQYLNQTYTLSNEASSSINYTVELSIPGTVDSADQWSGLLSGGGSVTHTVESHGDWIVNQSLSTVEKGQKKSRDSSLTTQYVYNWTRLKADLKDIDVSLSNVNLSSTCGIDTTGDISPTDSLLTEECGNKTFGVDHVTENLSTVSPVNETALIGSTIQATRRVQVNNTAGLDFQNLSTTTAFNQEACSQENRSVIDLPGQAEKEFTVDYSCSTGSVYGQDTEVLLNTPSSYYDTVKLNFNIEVPSNVTEESTLKVKLDKDNAPEWDNRESSSVDINASGSGLNINETEEGIFVIVPDDYGNSSLHEGTYNGILKYKYRTSSEGGGTGGSSGGSGPPPKPTNNTTVKASFDTQQYYEVDYGGTQVKYLTVYNFDKEPNRVTVATRNSTACSFVEVKPAVNVQEPYSENVTTLVPSKTQGTYKQSSSILIKAKFKIPNKEKLRELGLEGKFTCKFDTEASQGDAGPLAVTIKPVQRFDPVQELMKLVPQLPDQLVKSEKVCLSSSLSSAYSYQDSGKCKGQVEQVPVPTKDSAGLLGTAVFGFLLIAWIRKR